MKKIFAIIYVFIKCSIIVTAQTTTSGSTIYTSDASGFVGIKTTTPVTELHVQGHGSFGDSVTSANSTRSLNLVDDSAVMRIVRVHAINAPAVELLSRKTKDGSNVSFWDFYTQPSDASFRIRDRNISGNSVGLDMLTIAHNTGNVGIGTTDTKGYKLAVAGSAGIVAEKVVVKKQINWPDYVFNENYKLRPLADLETYINRSNHLPEVPSAEEIEEGGLDLAKTQVALLKKIEELTLYVIELNKKVKKLEAEK